MPAPTLGRPSRLLYPIGPHIAAPAGMVGDSTGLTAILKQESNLSGAGPLVGFVENYGPNPLFFGIKTSSNNANGDFATGSISIIGNQGLVSGAKAFTLNDGVHSPVTFTSNSDFTADLNAVTTAEIIKVAINAAANLDITAFHNPVLATITLKNDTKGAFNAAITGDAEYLKSGMTGGVAPDAYAGVNIRVGGSNVAFVQVNPGARVEFLLEMSVSTKPYLAFFACAESGLSTAAQTSGLLQIVHWYGDLVRRESTGTP